MFTLLYSEKARKFREPNLAKAKTGEVIPYTCMGDERVHGPWKSWYKWDDAKVVGEIEDYSQIVYISPSPLTDSFHHDL